MHDQRSGAFRHYRPAPQRSQAAALADIQANVTQQDAQLGVCYGQRAAVLVFGDGPGTAGLRSHRGERGSEGNRDGEESGHGYHLMW